MHGRLEAILLGFTSVLALVTCDFIVHHQGRAGWISYAKGIRFAITRTRFPSFCCLKSLPSSRNLKRQSIVNYCKVCQLKSVFIIQARFRSIFKRFFIFLRWETCLLDQMDITFHQGLFFNILITIANLL